MAINEFSPRDLRDNVIDASATQPEIEPENADLSFVRRSLQSKVDTEQPNSTEAKEGEWVPKFALLVISGKGSVGNTSTADYAAKLYGIPEERVFHAGEKFREYRDRMNPEHPDHESVAFIERPEHLDQIIDELVIKKLLEASVENPMIVEAKLGGALLRYVEQQAKRLGATLPTPRAAILKWADRDKRAEIARKKEGTEVLTLKEIQKQSSERDKRDTEQWVKVHSWLQGYSNILDKNARDDEGNPLYQDFVDASEHSGPEEDFEDLNEKLVRLGLVVPKEREMHAEEEIWVGYTLENNLPDNPLVAELADDTEDIDDIDAIGIDHEGYKPQFGNPF